MAKHACHKRTPKGKAQTLARKSKRQAKYAYFPLDF